MPISKPMKIMTLRISDEEKARLEELAREQNVTVSLALREGAKLYLQELRELARDQERDVATS